MATWVALLRGVNVGGRGRLPMADLRAAVEQAGGRDVRTYVQSGNVVFADDGGRTADELGDAIAAAVEVAAGFRPAVLVLGSDAFLAALAANPFPEATADPRSLHVVFLAGTPDAPDLDRLEAVRTDRERYALDRAVLYLWCPDGLGRSKLAAAAERAVGVAATARNWRTVTAVAALVEEVTRLDADSD